MAPSSKPADGRRKSGAKPSLLVTLSVLPSLLREIMTLGSANENTPSVKDSSASKDVKGSPSNSANSAPPPNSNVENASDSTAATPAAEGTKRSAATANGSTDGIPKPRGKPGPKKKPRLDDGTIDHSGAANRPAGGHKLGPKANQGAINAGLRALDRTGKPCRKWARGGFTLKSFTGVVWEVCRWTAPPKKVPESSNDDSGAPSADNSSAKENKEIRPDPNSASNSNSGADVEMRSPPSVNASSPTPMAVMAAS